MSKHRKMIESILSDDSTPAGRRLLKIQRYIETNKCPETIAIAKEILNEVVQMFKASSSVSMGSPFSSGSSDHRK